MERMTYNNVGLAPEDFMTVFYYYNVTLRKNWNMQRTDTSVHLLASSTHWAMSGRFSVAIVNLNKFTFIR